MGEFRALLSLYNIGMEEVRGEAGGRAYHGIVYTALDADGNKVATPIKSARLGRMAGAEGLATAHGVVGFPNQGGRMPRAAAPSVGRGVAGGRG